LILPALTLVGRLVTLSIICALPLFFNAFISDLRLAGSRPSGILNSGSNGRLFRVAC